MEDGERERERERERRGGGENVIMNVLDQQTSSFRGIHCPTTVYAIQRCAHSVLLLIFSAGAFQSSSLGT